MEAVLSGGWTFSSRWRIGEFAQEPRVGGAIRGRLQDLQTGCEWHFDGQWHELLPPRRLACSLRAGTAPGTAGVTAGLQIEFVEHEGRCELVIAHSGVRSAAQMNKVQTAWTQVLESLALLVERSRT